MPSAEERRRLVRQYFDGQPGPMVAVLKCAAGIAILLAVATGPWLVLSAGRSDTAVEAGQPGVADPSGPVAQSRRIFEERRERFVNQEEGTKAALAK